MSKIIHKITRLTQSQVRMPVISHSFTCTLRAQIWASSFKRTMPNTGVMQRAACLLKGSYRASIYLLIAVKLDLLNQRVWFYSHLCDPDESHVLWIIAKLFHPSEGCFILQNTDSKSIHAVCMGTLSSTFLVYWLYFSCSLLRSLLNCRGYRLSQLFNGISSLRQTEDDQCVIQHNQHESSIPHYY